MHVSNLVDLSRSEAKQTIAWRVTNLASIYLSSLGEWSDDDDYDDHEDDAVDDDDDEDDDDEDDDDQNGQDSNDVDDFDDDGSCYLRQWWCNNTKSVCFLISSFWGQQEYGYGDRLIS